ncbi:RsiV family protein [Mycobacterium sp. JS623]|uniref:RsiV family protein n=1 Tax=Mycobacterium sp. JS623 TaxID=212767 RepID=UPI000301E819|nr:RsiV family protein [Mycobacterium sp. JS623]
MLNPIVQRELGKHRSTPVRDDLDANTYRNFAITDDAVIFFFGEDAVVPDNSGPHQVSVPRSELAPLLA